MLITLTTDFGLHDSFVGQMKGVILGIAPGCQLVDLSHEVPPQDVTAGGLVIESALDAFPPQTVHLAVVDPGVGSARHALAIQTDAGYLVGPDNGLFTAALAKSPCRQAVRLTNPRFHRQAVSSTFHGRDIFAPAAAHLARGIAIHELGERTDQLVLLSLPHPVDRDGGLEINVLSVDRFGNLITDLTTQHYVRWKGATSDSAMVISLGLLQIGGIHRTFADVAVNQPVAYFGSMNRLEIGLRNGNAATTYAAAVGTKLHLKAFR